MNAEYGAKPITCPKPVLRRRVWSSYALEPVVNLDFQWARRHPAHQRLEGYLSIDRPVDLSLNPRSTHFSTVLPEKVKNF